MTWFEDPAFANKICKLVYEKYKRLGKKGKPDTGREWTMLAAVVGVFEKQEEQEYRMELISLGTGSKCLGRTQLSSSGNLLNDSHAEVIARRGFLRYLYYQLQMAYGSKASIFKVEEQHTDSTCSLKHGITFHLFTSHTPCGDASIFPKGEDETLVVESSVQRKRRMDNPHSDVSQKYVCQDSIESNNIKTKTEPMLNNFEVIRNEIISGCSLAEASGRSEPEISRPGVLQGVSMKTKPSQDIGSQIFCQVQDIHRTGAKCVPAGIQDSHGSGVRYHSLGVLRTKPGRGDPTMSMSCSDKLMKWCILGCQGALVSHFLEKPIYFSSVTIGKCPYSEEALKRALILRACKVKGLSDGYSLRQPRIFQADAEFEYAKRKLDPRAKHHHQVKKAWKLVPSPSAMIWINKPSFHEISVNGLKQGVTKANRESPKARVCICKAELFSEFKKVITVRPNNWSASSMCSDSKTYKDFKNKATKYNRAKEQLCDVFRTWLRKPSQLEMFT